MNNDVMKPSAAPASKLAWAAPSLTVLDVRATMADGPIWEFTPEGEFWKRQLLITES